MNRTTSIYLDLFRLGAALVVFLGHASSVQFSGGFLWQTQRYGEDAVVIFFVLSGYVIGYATSTRERDATTYAVNRLARIFSVALPALALTALLNVLGFGADGTAYHGGAWSQGPGPAPWLAGLLFVGEIWNWHVVPPGDPPYWSLGFEVAYYLLFGLLWFGRLWPRVAVIGLLLLMGPKLSLYFILWLMGLGGYHLTTWLRPRHKFGVVVWVATLAGMAAVAGPTQPVARIFAPFEPTSSWFDAFQHYILLAALFAANIVGFSMASPRLAGIFDRARPAIRYFAGATFSIYLFHFPLLLFLLAVVHLPPSSWGMRLVLFGLVPVLCLALAEVTERRKHVWRRALIEVSGRVRQTFVSLAARIALATGPEPGWLYGRRKT